MTSTVSKVLPPQHILSKSTIGKLKLRIFLLTNLSS